MKIIIDLQGAQATHMKRGIGRYSLSFTKALIENAKHHEVLIALNGSFPEAINYIRFELDNLLPQENIRVWHPFPSIAGINLANASRTSVAQKLREAFLASLKPDIVHISSLFEGFVDDAVTSIGTQEPSLITSTTLYDLIPLLHREIYLKNPILQHWYEQKLDHLRRTQLYLAISDSSRNEAIEYLNASEEMVINVSTAADPHFQPIDVDAQTKKSVCQTYGIIKPFILYAGGIDPRKNISGLIQAFSLLPHELQKKYQLVIVCVIEDHQRVILKNECASKKLNSQDVIFTGHVPEKDLVLLYNSCDLFIFPSWHEGFGLPALEAMACGAATIAGNLSSLPEVIGRADALFDPHSPQSIANKITKTLTDLSFQQSLKEHALEQAKKFSWGKSAKIAIDAFEAIHEKNHRPISTSTASSQNRLLQALRATKNVSENLLEIAQAISFNEPNSFQKRLFIDI
ncbi:MAG: glycosyl transferase group 1, partial [Gammaproteobacteria bacterium]|nr:glycosyl transferase group 1 [Gammaproteobacteria bacterium]